MLPAPSRDFSISPNPVARNRGGDFRPFGDAESLMLNAGVDRYFGQIASAAAERGWLVEHPKVFAESTETGYRQTYRRVLRTRSVDLANQCTARSNLAAFEYSLEQLLLNTEPYNDSALIFNYGALVTFRCAMDMAQGSGGESREQIVRFGVYLQNQSFDVAGLASSEVRTRVPRVRRLSSLPADWCERMLDSLSTELPLAREALIVLGLLGCRPEELKSAQIQLLDSGRVEISVASVKRLGGAIPVRRGAEYECAGPASALMHLCDLVEEYPFAHFGPKCLDNLLRRTSRVALPNVHPEVSAYCYRNAVASDLKRAGFSREDIALLLGHTTTRQQKAYGRARYGRSSSAWLPTQIIKSHEVRSVRAPYAPDDETSVDGEDSESES